MPTNPTQIAQALRQRVSPATYTHDCCSVVLGLEPAVQTLEALGIDPPRRLPDLAEARAFLVEAGHRLAELYVVAVPPQAPEVSYYEPGGRAA